MQQGLVAEDNGNVAFLHGGVGLLLAQPVVHILRLHRFGGCGHVLDMLDVAEVIKGFRRQFVAKEFQVAGDEGAGLVEGALVQVILVVVPVEQCVLFPLQIEEEAFLHLAQHVESHHHVRPVGVGQCQFARFQFVVNVAVERTLVGHSFVHKLGVERGVYAWQCAPQLDETLLHL